MKHLSESAISGVGERSSQVPRVPAFTRENFIGAQESDRSRGHGPVS